MEAWSEAADDRWWDQKLSRIFTIGISYHHPTCPGRGIWQCRKFLKSVLLPLKSGLPVPGVVCFVIMLHFMLHSTLKMALFCPPGTAAARPAYHAKSPCRSSLSANLQGFPLHGAYGIRTHGLLNAIQTRSQLRQCPIFCFSALFLSRA